MTNIWRKVKRALKDWINRLAETNKKEFGGAELACCHDKKKISN
jgi:hypothetical protein